MQEGASSCFAILQVHVIKGLPGKEGENTVNMMLMKMEGEEGGGEEEREGFRRRGDGCHFRSPPYDMPGSLLSVH